MEKTRAMGPSVPGLFDLGLDLDRNNGATHVHVKLSLETDLPREATAPAASLVSGPLPTPEVIFGPKGHGAIVAIAMSDLDARRPHIKAKVDAILGKDPRGRTDYFRAANWPDHIKGNRPETKPWHYVDFIYDPESSEVSPALPEAPHAISALAAVSEQLRKVNKPEEKADALCFVLHLIGDMHQPLHCITRVTPDLPAPEGDRGGTLLKLRGHYRSLHSLWDDSINLSLQDSSEELAVEIMKQYPRENLARELAMKSPEGWVRAGYALAVERCYKPLEDGGGDALRTPNAYLREALGAEQGSPSLEADGGAPWPSNTYLHDARDIGQRQAALGGYRLADWLADLLGG